MAFFGSFALLIALALAAWNLLAGALALRLIATGQPTAISPERLADTARRAGIAGFWAVTAAAFALIWSVFTNDFSLTYIMEHSNRALPAAYKFSALWSGQEGSLLLWAWLLGAYGFVLRLTHKRDVKLYAYAGAILAGIQVFFLSVLCFAAPPFALLKGAIPEDGNGLNPLLQYPEMVIHPPMLYLGYVGFSVPFAFALGALMMRYPGEKWIRITRVWTLVTWLFLSFGIVLGMHWAYAVLGWGGYWGWDPVEIASLMPWLTATAFLHSVMMQEKKGMMKSWNVWLIFTTFLLTMLGTLLTRAGLVSSVHAFAQSSIGTGSSSSWGSCWRSASRASRIMRTMKFELSALEVYEVGKSWKEADADVAEAIDYLEYYGHEMIRLGKPRLLGDYPGELNGYVYEPKGVGVIISPWNFPLAIPAGMVSGSHSSPETQLSSNRQGSHRCLAGSWLRFSGRQVCRRVCCNSFQGRAERWENISYPILEQIS